MKRVSILLILPIIPLILLGQKTKLKTVKYYKSNTVKEEYRVLKKNKHIRHGTYTYYHENGVIKKTGNYNMNKRNGDWKEFDENGRLKRIVEYQNGRKTEDKKVGIWLKYHEKGKVITGFDYDKNKKIETIIYI